MSKPIQSGQQPERGVKPSQVGKESPIAMNPSSNGGILPESSKYSFFIFVISFAWTDTSFEDWSKHRLASSLSTTLVNSMDFKKSETKEAMLSTLKSHLNTFSINQLRTLEDYAKEHPDFPTYVAEMANTPPSNLHEGLLAFTTPPGTSTKKIPEDEPQSAELYDTDISCGKSGNFLYEIRLSRPGVPNLSQNLAEYKTKIEIVLTNPQTGESRRMKAPFKIEEETSGLLIMQELNNLEHAIQSFSDDSDFFSKHPNKSIQDIGLAFKQLRNAHSSRYPPPENVGHFVDIYMEGNIFKTEAGPSLFPSKPTMLHAGTIPPLEIERAQRILRGDELKQEGLPSIKVHIDKKGNRTDLGCKITSKTVESPKNADKYLDVTFKTQTKDHILIYTARIPYNTGETKGALIERIGKDGALASAMLMAASAFTREIVTGERA